MDELRGEAERVLSALHEAIARGDRPRVSELVLGGWSGDLAFLGEHVPRPGAATFVGAIDGGARWIVYALEDARGLWLAKLHRGRDGVTRIEPTGARAQRARGESAQTALERYATTFGAPQPTTSAKRWAPVPSAASLDAITWVGLSKAGTRAEELDQAERALGARLPEGYRDYVSRFGEALDTLLLRVYPPARVVTDLASWRTRIDAYWLWAPASDAFGPDEASRSVVLADTLNGDELLFFPERPDRFYVLPRDHDSVAMLRGSFAQACAWIIESGELVGAASGRWAQPLQGLVRETWLGEREDDEDDEDVDDVDDADDTVGQSVADALADLDPRGRAIATHDDDGGWTILLPSIGGTAFVFRGGARVSIERDPRAPTPALERVAHGLGELGLRRAADDHT